jgi:hypothetical protein
MSLTSYRAAPPRVGVVVGGERVGRGGRAGAVPVAGWWVDLAATYSPTSWDAVPWALRGFTAEFGMGSGGAPALSATRSTHHPLGRSAAKPRSGAPAPGGEWSASLGMKSWHGDGGLWWSLTGDEVDRAIRTGQLSASPRVHFRPIDVVVCHGPWARPGFAVGFPLRCVQRLSRPDLATRLRGWRHDRSTRGPSTPVLSY